MSTPAKRKTGWTRTRMLDINVPLVFPGGGRYATVRVPVELTANFQKDDRPAIDDDRRIDFQISVRTPWDQMIPAHVRVPVRALRGDGPVSVETWPVIITPPGTENAQPEPPTVIVNLPEQPAPVVNIENLLTTPPRKLTVGRDKKTGQITSAELEDI